jgi:hypothetical protein
LFPWDALSDERTRLSFVCATGPCQRSLSRVLVPWDLRPYFTVPDLRLPFSSPPTTRWVTVEVFDPASTRLGIRCFTDESFITSREPNREHYFQQFTLLRACPLLREPCVNSVATLWFPNVYNFQFPYLWKPCSVNSRFPRINLSMATCLPIRFLETAHMSQHYSDVKRILGRGGAQSVSTWIQRRFVVESQLAPVRPMQFVMLR